MGLKVIPCGVDVPPHGACANVSTCHQSPVCCVRSTLVQLFAVHAAPESNFDELRTTVVATADALSRGAFPVSSSGRSREIKSDQVEEGTRVLVLVRLKAKDDGSDRQSKARKVMKIAGRMSFSFAGRQGALKRTAICSPGRSFRAVPHANLSESIHLLVRCVYMTNYSNRKGQGVAPVLFMLTRTLRSYLSRTIFFVCVKLPAVSL